MKKTAFLFLLFSASIFSGCKKNSDIFTVGVDVQSSFDQDNVQVIIDGQTLINKTLQTNHLLGVCYKDGQITTAKDKGKHVIKIIVNNTATKTETFELNKNLYIGINYNSQSDEISFLYSDQRFLYD